jgi:hypothetical protein
MKHQLIKCFLAFAITAGMLGATSAAQAYHRCGCGYYGYGGYPYYPYYTVSCKWKPAYTYKGVYYPGREVCWKNHYYNGCGCKYVKGHYHKGKWHSAYYICR